MERIRRRLEKLTTNVLSCTDPTSEEGVQLNSELRLMQELAKTHNTFENSVVTDMRVQQRLNDLTKLILKARGDAEAFAPDTFITELKLLQEVMKTWNSASGIELDSEEAERNRKSAKTWDGEEGSLTTKIKLTERQEEALYMLDCGRYDKFLAVGGSGSGKSFVLTYKIIRDTLRHKAPCLIARDKLIDLRQGVIDQIIPEILNLIAEANGQERWDMWTIDGLKFAKWTDKRSKLEFATGGYIRCAGLSARDLSESGSDKILSPSWFHVMLEEVSELEYETVEKILTRLRYHVEGVLNVLMMNENPPSINHWSYKRYFEFKREDGSTIPPSEQSTMAHLLMNPKDNIENVGETYIRTLSQLTGANYERFYKGAFQEAEEGEVFKRMDWVSILPMPHEWDRLVIYTDPTPLTGKDHSVWADYKASVLCGLFGGDTYVIDLRIVKGSTMEMLQNMKQLWDVSPNQSITDVVMENKQVPSDFDQVMEVFSTMTGWICPVHRDKRIFTDKVSSIELFLQPLFENSLIHFNEEFKDTERGRQAQTQILKFSRKSNKMIKDDIPDAIMRADTYMKGRKSRRRQSNAEIALALVSPAYVQKETGYGNS